jgi:signal transduction histidine kinase
MAEKGNVFEAQLKQTCRITGAQWAVWLERTDEGWNFSTHYALNKNRAAALKAFLDQPKMVSWLSGALSGGRMRSKSAASFPSGVLLDCQHLYVFPNTETQSAILVGADQLSDLPRGFFRVLSLQAPSNLPAPFPITDDRMLILPLEARLDTSYNLAGVLERILAYLAEMVGCDTAYIAIRSGNYFRLEATWKPLQPVTESTFSIQENAILARLVANRQGVIIMDAHQESGPHLDPGMTKRLRSWMGVPILVGHRVIGTIVFGSNQPGVYSQTDLQRASVRVGRVAHGVEGALVFAEIARYLQQLALLNEMAMAASTGSDIDEATRRVRRLLRRTFRTDQVSVLLLSADGKTLREYAERQQTSALAIPVEGSLLGSIVTTGQPINVLDFHEIATDNVQRPEVRSELAVPLKFHGEVIGILDLLSPSAGAFTLQDQQLLVVIASHLAALIENIRLNAEARQRARNLSLIHQVVRGVVGLTECLEITRTAARMLADYFDYDVTVVYLLDENDKEMVAEGVGGKLSAWLPAGSRFPAGNGVTGQVLKSGSSYITNDTSQDPYYYPSSEWRAGSEMCVPLMEGERIFGIIDVEQGQKYAFSGNDLLVVESLAGVLSSVIMNALRYQQLRILVRHLEAFQETALDISTDLDLDVVLRRVVHRVQESVDARGVELGLINEQDQVVEIYLSENPWQDDTGRRIPLMAGAIGQVAALGEPFVVNDYQSWSGRYDEGVPYRIFGGVPLKYTDRVIGVIAVTDDRPERYFTQEDIHLLEFLAPQIAASIRNAQLYKELQAHIDAQHVAESRLIRSARLAAVGEMAAGVAHELNNPLTTVAGFVELVLEDLPSDSPQRVDLELVLREAHRARSVVRHLLDFSRPVENVRARTDPNGLVNDVLALMQHLIRTNGVQLRMELGKNLPLVWLDPNQIKQVLLNLVHNALQAMPLGGVLTIQTLQQNRSEREWLNIRVNDTGSGIAAENLDRIFEPFYTTREPGAGTGLGLSVSYGIVAEHGGFIEVDSQVNEGSCFTIWLPVNLESR